MYTLRKGAYLTAVAVVSNMAIVLPVSYGRFYRSGWTRHPDGGTVSSSSPQGSTATCASLLRVGAQRNQNYIRSHLLLASEVRIIHYFFCIILHIILCECYPR